MIASLLVILAAFTWLMIESRCLTVRLGVDQRRQMLTLSSVGSWLGWFYVHVILYYAGAALTDEELEELKGGGDRWTFWFRRSKKRLGALWWVAVIVSLLVINIRLISYIKNKRWVVTGMTVLFDLFCCWLIPHILGAW